VASVYYAMTKTSVRFISLLNIYNKILGSNNIRMYNYITKNVPA